MTDTEPTGERVMTSQIDQIMTEHLHRYALAAAYASGKVVLDIACGEGYGSNLLASVAAYVYGVDIAESIIINAQNRYKRENLRYHHGSATQIPVPDHSIDLIVSFETIEHHDQHEQMLQEFKRVLRKSGMLIISSPDKKNYSDEPGYQNPFHIKELYEQEFSTLISRHFTNVSMMGQRYLTGSVILSSDGSREITEYNGSYTHIEQQNGFAPVYNIAVASDDAVPAMSNSIFTHQVRSDEDDKAAIARRYTNSTTWKIGRAILSPFLLIKHIIGK